MNAHHLNGYQMEFACTCGTTRLESDGKPLFRILCHCTICQKYNSAPFADVLVFRAEDVTLPPPGAVDFETYKPPPNVRRGKCTSCTQPAIETFIVPIFPKLVMVPAPMFSRGAEVPEPIAHIFYDKRLSDATDAYPKHRGFLSSQLAFMKYLRRAKR